MENDLNINNVNLPYPEPLMPCEDAPSPQTQKHLKSYSEAVKETMDILAEADAVKAQKEQKKADMKRQARTLLLIFIAVYLYAQVFLVHWAAFCAMFLPAAVSIGKRMIKRNMSFKEAAEDSIVCIILTVLFCIISI